ncbi:MAG TPA: flagellar type III secretion system pore protein FliP [Planctomycetaceae bacterium]|nr:flagellar type III secretion system pore protein FliP [Planctomycetaceae bacterium]
MVDARILYRAALALLTLAAMFAPATAWAQGGRVSVPRAKEEFAGPGERVAVGKLPPAEAQVPPPPQLNVPLQLNPEQFVSPQGMSSTLNLMILLTVLSLAPSILMMTTCFIRFIIVMGLLRQALGTQTLPPNQVIISLCLFLTFMAMAPVWQESYTHGIYPYTHPDEQDAPIGLDEAFRRTALPIRRFMGDQIDRAGNSDTVWLFVDAQRPDPDTPEGRAYRDPENYDEVPLLALLPAYMLSELKTAFIIGFQIYLPFVVIDMVIATVLTAMGMMMLPPVMISLPFKLLLFVLIDGWGLTVGMLLESVRPFG